MIDAKGAKRLRDGRQVGLSAYAFMGLLILIEACVTSAQGGSGPWLRGIVRSFGGPQSQGGAFKATLDDGACGLGETDPRLYPFYQVAALHRNNPLAIAHPLGGCGMCIEIRCIDGDKCRSDGTVTIVVSDQCAQNCVAEDLNIHVFAFERIAPFQFGEVRVEYRQVDCAPPGDIQVLVKGYRESLGGYLKLALRNVACANDITGVDLRGSEVRGAGNTTGRPASQFLPMLNQFGAAWETSGLPTPPIDLLVRFSDGDSLLLEQVLPEGLLSGVIYPTSQQKQCESALQPLPPRQQNPNQQPAGPAGPVAGAVRQPGDGTQSKLDAVGRRARPGGRRGAAPAPTDAPRPLPRDGPSSTATDGPFRSSASPAPGDETASGGGTLPENSTVAGAAPMGSGRPDTTDPIALTFTEEQFSTGK